MHRTGATVSVVATTAAVTLQRASAKCSRTANGKKTKMNSEELKSIAQPISDDGISGVLDYTLWPTAADLPEKGILVQYGELVQGPARSSPVAQHQFAFPAERVANDGRKIVAHRLPAEHRAGAVG